MIKSTLFRQAPKQVKLPQGSSNKTVSLAEVAQQLQSTAIADDDVILSVPILSTDHTVEGTKSAEKRLKTCECSGQINKTTTGVRTVCLKDINDSCASRSGPSQLRSNMHVKDEESLPSRSQLLIPSGPNSDADGSLNFESGRSLVLEPSSGVTEYQAHKRLRLKSKQPSAVTVASPSAFGLTLCFNARRSRSLLVRRDGRKWPAVGKGVIHKGHISELSVVGHLAFATETMPGNVLLKQITAFDFSTPSPDDIVRDRQKSAFRS